MPPDQQKVDFGFARVAADEKAPLVRDVFARVARRYDVMNDLMSLGLHRAWKAALVDWLMPRPGRRYLDLAGGTGDVARRIAAAARGQAEIVVCDINEAMLAAGPAAPSRTRVAGDAENLPFADASFDGVTIAFGLRNVTRIDRALAEAWRVLKPGGRFICLEFTPLETPLLGRAYDWYSFQVIPRLGQAVAGDRAAYQYLVESIRRFPRQAELAARMRAAGFGRVASRTLGAGVVALHSGWRL